MSVPSTDRLTEALATVQDPEINRPLTELGMVKDVQIGADGSVRVEVYLTVAGCPMRETITSRVTEAVSKVPGVERRRAGQRVGHRCVCLLRRGTLVRRSA